LPKPSNLPLGICMPFSIKITTPIIIKMLWTTVGSGLALIPSRTLITVSLTQVSTRYPVNINRICPSMGQRITRQLKNFNQLRRNLKDLPISLSRNMKISSRDRSKSWWIKNIFEKEMVFKSQQQKWVVISLSWIHGWCENVLYGYVCSIL